MIFHLSKQKLYLSPKGVNSELDFIWSNVLLTTLFDSQRILSKSAFYRVLCYDHQAADLSPTTRLPTLQNKLSIRSVTFVGVIVDYKLMFPSLDSCLPALNERSLCNSFAVGKDQ